MAMKRTAILLCLAAGCAQPQTPMPPVREDCPPVQVVRVMGEVPDSAKATARSVAANEYGVRVEFVPLDIDAIDAETLADRFPGEFVIVLVDKIKAGDCEQLARGGAKYAIISAEADASVWELALFKALYPILPVDAPPPVPVQKVDPRWPKSRLSARVC